MFFIIFSYSCVLLLPILSDNFAVQYLSPSKMKKMDMHILHSPRVLHTITSLPAADRIAVATAVTGEFILGTGTPPDLTPLQTLVMAVIRQYVRHDSAKISSRI